jgi:hypothetical protein
MLKFADYSFWKGLNTRAKQLILLPCHCTHIMYKYDFFDGVNPRRSVNDARIVWPTNNEITRSQISNNAKL